jgi:phosphopantetheinyl transferase
LGIDAENRRNFVPPYPYNRVFSKDDFFTVAKFCTTMEDSAAMIWVCKEAVVKNKGTGFHGIDPRDVHLLSCRQRSPFIYQAVVCAPDRKEVSITRERDVWFALSVSK